jgi:YHS domain-containing protein
MELRIMNRITFILILFFASLSVSSAFPGALQRLKKQENQDKNKLPEATACYLCTRDQTIIKLDSSKPRTCPFENPCSLLCPAHLQYILPKKGETYSMEDYELPNSICPVMGLPARTAFSAEYKGKTIYFYSPGSAKKFLTDPQSYLMNLPLKKESVKLHPTATENRTAD